MGHVKVIYIPLPVYVASKVANLHRKEKHRVRGKSQKPQRVPLTTLRPRDKTANFAL